MAIGQKALSLDDFSDILFKKKRVVIDGPDLDNIDINFQFLQNFAAGKIIYGINTGLGPMAQYEVTKEHALPLQYNLIRSHCSGSGHLLPQYAVRALMIARLNSLMQAFSGIHTNVVLLLKDLLNNDILPCIYEHGGVGASGDLVQLAHLGLVLIGEGEVMFEGKIYPTMDIFDRFSLKPIVIHVREGLAIINGTSAMTGIGLLNIIRAQKLLEWSVILSAMTNEVVGSFDDHFSYELNQVKHHKGQSRIGAMMRQILNGSKMIRNRSELLYLGGSLKQGVFEDKVQEYYSLRCVTQILGPVYDTICQSAKILVDELNSANDNPVIDHKNNGIFHGGNFHGDYVSMEMDKLKIAVTKLSMLSERQLNYLLNDKLNQKLPPFVNLGLPGLNFGMQGMQFTATSTVAENQTMCFPMCVHSIPSNNDNQDIVSMGCNAAMMTQRVIDNSFTVLSIQLMTVLQAIDYLGCGEKLSPLTRSVYTAVRSIFPVFTDDHPKYKDLQKIRVFLEKSETVISFNE